MIKRDLYLNKLIEKKDNGFVKVITGLRRSGKSYLLKNIYFDYLLQIGINKENIIIIDMDDISNLKFQNPLILDSYIRSQIFGNSKYYVFIDEIQKVVSIDNPYIKGDVVTFVDVLLGLMKIDNVDIYVTGSNSKMLSTDILTDFRDRGDEIKVFPLSFNEVYQHFGGDKHDLLRTYMTYGGMPLVYTQKNADEKQKYLIDLYKRTYIKNIIERNNIYNDDLVLDELLQITASSVGSLLSYNKLTKSYKSIKNTSISPETIKRYIEFFTDSFLIDKTHRFDIKGRKYIDGPQKYYFSDIGIRNAVLNFRQQEKNHLMENVIFNELRCRGYLVDVGSVDYVYKNNEGKSERKQLEIDFVVNKADKRIYIQSALNIDDDAKKIQEKASLMRINDSFKKMIVIGAHIAPYYDENGILIIGLLDFLSDTSFIER